MSLVFELQAAAIDPNINVRDLLRRSFLVAKKLGATRFEEWIHCEMNGYPPNSDLPPYRIVSGHVITQHPFRGWQTLDIQDPTLAKMVATRGIDCPINQVIASMQAVKSGNGIITFTLSAYEQVLRSLTSHNWPLLYSVGTDQMEKLLNSVRDAILNWALKLEADGILGEGMSFTLQEKQAAATHNYYGPIGAVQHGSRSSSHTNQYFGENVSD